LTERDPLARPGPPVGEVCLGDLKRTEPISRKFGGDRGTPVDRYYIENFLETHARDIRGRVLEIGENVYTRRFGGHRVTQSDILDAPASDNERATIVADLASCPEVRGGRFDCIILTQTLHMIYDVKGVLASVERLLAPGGTLLATVPCISQIDAGSTSDSWFWYMTPRCARLFFEERFPGEQIDITPYGNVLAATAFLHGLALEEMDRSDMDVRDPQYPVITGVRATKSP